MNTLKLQTLENALSFWEDQNMIGELFFVAENNQLVIPTKSLRPLPGTEINSVGLFGRKIPNFEFLRKDLQKGFFNPEKYLPRIPKKDLGNIQKLIDDSFFFPTLPLIFSDWVSTKKVCRISQDSNIPQITNKNYLRDIPYNNFVLLLDDPFSYERVDGFEINVILDFSTFFISKEDNILTVYAISDNVKDYLLTEELRKSILKATNLAIKKRKFDFDKSISKIVPTLSKIRDRPHFSFFKFEIDILDPFYSKVDQIRVNFANFLVKSMRKMFGKKTYDDFIKKDRLMKLVNERFEFEKGLESFFPKFLNGICKILLETSVESISTSTTKPRQGMSLSKNQDLEWNEVPLGTVLNLSVDKDGKIEVSKDYNVGSEKSFHIRAGHYRKYIQKDGSVKSVWIKSTEIRPDKSPKFGGKVMSGVKTL